MHHLHWVKIFCQCRCLFCLYFFCQLKVSIIFELEITVQAEKALDWNDLWICGQATKKKKEDELLRLLTWHHNRVFSPFGKGTTKRFAKKSAKTSFLASRIEEALLHPWKRFYCKLFQDPDNQKPNPNAFCPQSRQCKQENEVGILSLTL